MKKPGSVILSLWHRLRVSIPKIYLPLPRTRTKIDISITFISCIIFLCIRVTAERYFEIMRGWDPSSYRKKLISASVVSIVHALLLTPSLGVTLWTQPFAITSKMKDYPIIWQNAADSLLQFCTGVYGFLAVL